MGLSKFSYLDLFAMVNLLITTKSFDGQQAYRVELVTKFVLEPQPQTFLILKNATLANGKTWSPGGFYPLVVA
jgi:enoyl-CoA hydratase/carnithine racemase